MKTAVLIGIVFTVVCIVIPVGVTGVFMKMTPKVAEVTPYILRVYALSFIPLAINTFATYYLQAIDCSQMATTISISKGLVVNAILLYLFSLFLGGDGVWWAIFWAEMLTAVLSIVYINKKYKEYKSRELA